MLFSFSSPSFHSSFPTFPWFSLNSLSTTCETYAMWLILELSNLLYSLSHHCPHMFLSIYGPPLYILFFFLMRFCTICPHHIRFYVFCFFSSISSTSLHRPGRSHFTCGSFISYIIITPVIAPPLTRLNSSSLLPFPLFCRAPVTPSGVTRTVSDSRRTCYLVTRL